MNLQWSARRSFLTLVTLYLLLNPISFILESVLFWCVHLFIKHHLTCNTYDCFFYLSLTFLSEGYHCSYFRIQVPCASNTDPDYNWCIISVSETTQKNKKKQISRDFSVLAYLVLTLSITTLIYESPFFFFMGKPLKTHLHLLILNFCSVIHLAFSPYFGIFVKLN